jgi:hypothetical protein
MIINRRTVVTSSAIAAAMLVLEGCSSSSSTSTSAASGSATGGGPPTGGAGGGLQKFTAVNLNTQGASPGGANTAEVVSAATRFLETLNPTQTAKVVYDFANNTARQTWSNFPTAMVPRSGMRMSDLTADQQAAVDSMLQAALGPAGALQDANIRQADDYLASLGGQGASDFGALKDYFVAVYGAPTTTAPFMIQFGGHHLARNLTYNGDKVSQTPQFVGSEPTSFPSGGSTIEPVKPESSTMFGMIAGLAADQKEAAHITSGTFTDLQMGPGQDTGAFPTAEGLLVPQLGADQRALVLAAIQAYAGDLAGDAATKIVAKYESELDQTRIGWVNAAGPSEEHSYIRIDGPSVWIEFINTRSPSTPNIHYHSVYRDKTNDYGSSKPT